MELLVLSTLLVLGIWVARSRDQQRRIALLASHLGRYQIETLMENLTEGYLRCLGEEDADRRTQIWGMLSATEVTLSEQFNRFSADFAKVGDAQARTSSLALALPFADKLLPGASFDVRRAFAIHAQGIADCAANRRDEPPKRRAFTMTAELFLMQHTCHWYCRSKTVASARMMARHKTSYAKLLASVSPATRRAYDALTGG